MYRYYDLIAQILAVVCGLSAIGSLLAGSYITMILGIGAAIFLWSYSKRLKKVEDRKAFAEDNPISSKKKRLYDEKIINKIKNAKYDPVNYQLKDLESGSLLDYNASTWAAYQVQYIYWHKASGEAMGEIDKKVQLETNKEKMHIQVHQDRPNRTVPITNPVNVYAIDEKMDSFIKDDTFQAPAKVTFEGKEYFREPAKSGYSINPTDFTYLEFESFEYFTKDLNNIIRLNYWGNRQIEAEQGFMSQETNFSNILPSSNDNDNIQISK